MLKYLILYKTYVRLLEKELDGLCPLAACLPGAASDSQHEWSNIFMDKRGAIIHSPILVNHSYCLIVIDITTII